MSTHIKLMQWLTMEEKANLQRRTLTSQENDVTIHNEYQADVDDFENVELDHHARLRDLTNEIDYLQQKVEANETQPMDAISHLECKLNRLTLTLYLSTLPGPLDEVLQQYMDTLCTAQK